MQQNPAAALFGDEEDVVVHIAFATPFISYRMLVSDHLATEPEQVIIFS